MKFSRRHSVRNVVLVASVTAVVGGGALALQLTGSQPSGHAAPTGVTAQNAAVDTHDCDVIHNDLRTKNDSGIDTGDALKCDQQEFAALEKARLAGGNGNRVQLSATCTAVNQRLAAGDPNVDEGLAEACRNRELFAFQTDDSNESGTGNQVTSMCVGKKKLDKTPEGSPAFEKDACSDKPFGQQPLPVSEKDFDPSSAPKNDVRVPSDSPSPSPTFDAGQCGAIDAAIKNKQQFDPRLGEQCVNAEAGLFLVGSGARTLGTACSEIDGLALQGDLNLPVNVVLACEHILQLQLRNTDGTLDRATDICKAARKQSSDQIDPQLAKVCAGEPTD